MGRTRLLTKEERAYILQVLTKESYHKEIYGKLSKKRQEELIDSIIEKLQSPQNLS